MDVDRSLSDVGEGDEVRFEEFGKDKEKVFVLVHPSLVMWDYYEFLIPYMEDSYHLIIPVLDGYDKKNRNDFTSVEEIAEKIEDYLLKQGIHEISGIYGCSMGGSVVLRFLADRKIRVHGAVIDGGITPYQLPWILTRCIAIRDFLMIYMGKLGGLKLLQKAFSTDEYSKEDLEYIADVLNFVSAKTIWRTFESCNNYAMPKEVQIDCERIEYWYAQMEKKDRKWDIDYVKKKVPQTVFREFENIGHGGLALLKPDLLAKELKRMTGEEDERLQS